MGECHRLELHTLQDFQLPGATGLTALQKQAQTLLKAISKIFLRQISWTGTHQGIQGKESILVYFNHFEQAFQQNSGTNDLNDATINLFNPIFIVDLYETLRTSLKQHDLIWMTKDPMKLPH